MIFKKKKHNCEKDGHLYEIKKFDRIVEVKKKNRPIVGVLLCLECRECQERLCVNSSYGTCNEIHNLWLEKKISLDKMEELSDFLDKKWEEFTKSKTKKKTKKSIK